jgi:uncharacterized membrane protein YkvA (DUF1232 family)
VTRLGTLLLALWKLMRHPATPWPARLAALLALAYALSPIDLIPDVVPLLGWLDDLLIVPLLIALAVRLTPRTQWHEHLAEAERATGPHLRRIVWAAGAAVVLWLLLLFAFAGWLWHLLG